LLRGGDWNRSPQSPANGGNRTADKKTSRKPPRLLPDAQSPTSVAPVVVVVVSDHTGGALAVERYTTREERDVGTTNLIYVLVVIILVLVAILLLAQLL